MGLVIEREIGESVVIGNDIVVTLTQIRGATPDATGRLRAKLLIQAPHEVKILRTELLARDAEQGVKP